MTASPRPATDPEVLTAAFVLVFRDCGEREDHPEGSSLRQGRSQSSCPVPTDTDLLNRIRDAVPAASPVACRDALVRAQRLSYDVTEICTAFREGRYGSSEEGRAAALCELAEQNPGFSAAEYRTAFNAGLTQMGR